MKELQNFSLNDYVYIKLINDGEEILVDSYSKCEDCDRDFVFKLHNYNDGWIKIQLWQIFSIFGRCLHMGNNKLPFEISNCKLEVK